MKKIFVGGLLLAVFTAIALWIGAALQLPLGAILFSGGVGTVLGLIKQGGPIVRIVSFLIGFVLSWALFGVQAALLPQLVVFWALLLGAATMVGAYQTEFANAPQNFLTESVTSAGGTLIGVALGLIVAAIMEFVGADEDEEPTAKPATPVAAAPTPPAVPNDPSILPTSSN